MSNIVLTRPRTFAAKRSFAIVASLYNPKYVQGLVDHACKEIYASIPSAAISLNQVPGAFEIPLLVQELARKGGYDAILALGVIIEGETSHASYIGMVVSQSLMKISLEFRIPVVHEVLSVKNEEQADQRCLQETFNRGTEAARVALQFSNVFSDFKEKHGN